MRWSAGSEDWRAEWAAAELSGPFGPPQSSVSPGSGFWESGPEEKGTKINKRSRVSN